MLYIYTEYTKEEYLITEIEIVILFVILSLCVSLFDCTTSLLLPDMQTSNTHKKLYTPDRKEIREPLDWPSVTTTKCDKGEEKLQTLKNSQIINFNHISCKRIF